MSELQISFGQYSHKGVKAINQDACAIRVPNEPLLSEKGIGIAIADGISTSDVSQIASQSAVDNFLEDYYSTAASWSVKSSAVKVISSINSWLFAQSQKGHYKYDLNKGYVCTFSAAIVKGSTAHVFHVGDTRIYIVRNNQIEPLTDDHIVEGNEGQTYLGRALGVRQFVDLDYKKVQVSEGELLLLMSDGAYEFVETDFIAKTLREHDNNLPVAATTIGEAALKHGSNDNISVQLVRLDQLPKNALTDVASHVATLPLPPRLEPRMNFDGYVILRELHINSRSQVYLAKDEYTEQRVVIKCPSTEKRGDPDYLESLLMEEWAARRVSSAHVIAAHRPHNKRNYIYSVFEYMEGETLAQWIIDNPRASIEQVRPIVEQIAKGLQAFHRKEMLHQDLRPANILIDTHGTVKIIDFGSAYIAGLEDTKMSLSGDIVPGTLLFTAPEYFLGQQGQQASDVFSLAVITYQMLSGKFPYGTAVGKCRSRAQQHKLRYQSILDKELAIPEWVDETLKKALQIDPNKRYNELSEFIHDLRQPNLSYVPINKRSLLERDEVMFWKLVSGALAMLSMVCVYFLTQST